MEAVNVAVICPTCAETRYNSVRPIGLKEKLEAKLFTPVGDAPPLSDGTPAECFECGTPLKFMKAVGGQPAKPELPSRTEMMNQRRETQVEAARDAAQTEILFEAKPGEDVREIRETPSGAIVITTKRIVRINF